jgi:hypothetical protein
MLKPNQYLRVEAIYIFLAAIAWTLYAYSKGVVMSPDSHTYSIWADTLIKYDFDISDFIENINFVYSPLFYFNWITVAAINKLLLGNSWGLGIVILNLLAGIIVATLLVKTTWSATGKPICSIFAGSFLLLCHDFYHWIPFVLSDILYSSLCFTIFILITGLYQQRPKPLRRVVGIVILLGYTFFFRPSWPPLLIFSILSISLALSFSLLTSDPKKRHKFIIGCTLLACILIPGIIFCHSYFMLHPEKWPFSFLGSAISYIAKDYQQGIVVYARPETYHFTPSNILEYAFISLHKFIAFFYIDVAAYSFKHALLNYIFFLPIYGLSILAIIKLFKKENGPSPSNWWCIFSCVFYIFTFAFFHSLHQIDFDFRYRVPCLLSLIFLATLGLNELINGFSKRA